MTIKNFHLSATNRQSLYAKIGQLDPMRIWLVNVTEAKKKRSIPQNRWMRGFAKDFGAYLGYTEDQMYDLIMYKFCPEFIRDPETGAEVRMPGHFSKKQDGTDRDTKDAAQIQELVLQWAAELGFIWDMEMAA
jgi:catalase